MSLVDYASSDEEEAERESFPVPKDKPQDVPKDDQPLPQPPDRISRVSPNEQSEGVHSSETSVLKLPDATLLLNATDVSSNLGSGTDHSSRVAAAVAECASRKREAYGSTSVLPRKKAPRQNLPHPRSVPDTGGGLLVPPQLSGRSNVVTEDISKLFVRKNGDSHLNQSQSPL